MVFHVDETPLVYTKLGDVNLGVVRNMEGIKAPTGFKETTTRLEKQDVEGYINEKLNLTIVYLVNEAGEKAFYIVNDEKVIRKYETIEINGKTYVLLDSLDSKITDSLKKDKVKIGDIELNGWTFEDKEHANYSVVYLMNDAGEKNLYSYESTEGTLQKYIPSVEKNDMNMMTYIFIGTTAVFAVSTATVAYLYMSFKKKSISAIRDYYASKNQDFD